MNSGGWGPWVYYKEDFLSHAGAGAAGTHVEFFPVKHMGTRESLAPNVCTLSGGNSLIYYLCEIPAQGNPARPLSLSLSAHQHRQFSVSDHTN